MTAFVGKLTAERCIAFAVRGVASRCEHERPDLHLLKLYHFLMQSGFNPKGEIEPFKYLQKSPATVDFYVYK